MSKFLDRNHPMFRRFWVRGLTVAFPLVWGAVEFWHAQPFWGLIFGAAGVYALYELFLRAPD